MTNRGKRVRLQPNRVRSIVAAALAATFIPRAALATEVWLTGIYRPFSENGPPGPMIDFNDMFRSGAPWPTAAQHVKVFATSTQVLQGMPEDDLRAMLASLRARHIGLSMEALILPGSRGCGIGVPGMEGYSAPGTMQAVAERIQRLGGTLDSIAMDEPLWFGHYDSTPGACHAPVEQIAQDVAGQVAAMRRIFPNMKVGDIEPVGNPEPRDWLQQMMAWTRAYEQAVGQKLDFFRADVNWTGPWQPALHDFAAAMRGAGIKYAVIYNGNGDERTAVAWTVNAERHFVSIEADPAMVPDQAMIQTWTAQPKRNLPDTEPGTMTNLVLRYVARPTRLTLEHSGPDLHGTLTDGQGHPIAGAPISLVAYDNGQARIGSTQELTGTVPANATNALIALRINLECRCDGPADVVLGEARYTEPGGAPVARRLGSPKATVLDGGDHYQIPAGQQVMVNTESFPVRGGQTYTLSIPTAVSEASRHSGYVTVIFRDKDNRGIRRDLLWFAPGTKSLGTATTDAAGRFVFRPPADLIQARPGFEAEYPGGEGLRLSAVRLQ